MNLINATSETSGRYKCEATGTSFQEVSLETHIEVLPGKLMCCGNLCRTLLLPSNC